MSKSRPTTLWKVTRHGLIPFGKSAWAEHMRFRLDAIVDVAVFEPKHNGQLSAYWAALSRVVDNTDAFPSSKALSNALLVHLGYFQRTRTLGGYEITEPMSISDMDRKDFDEFLTRAKVVLGTEIIPGLDVERLFKDREFYVEGEDIDDRI